MALTAKQQKFCDVFLVTGDKLQAVLASHQCSSKTASSMACQVYNSPKVKKYLAEYALKKPKSLSKEDYIDKALNIHDTLDKTQANAPRYYHIAGLALGHVGSNQDSRPHQTLIFNATLTGKEDKAKLLDNVRRLIQNNSQS